jgi:glyoxylase-like metal-dependent hydrolase (beta-lactamase superfamily II)
VTEIRDVADGIWIWRNALAGWRPERGFPAAVASTCVRSGGEVAVLDPIDPADDEVWRRLDRQAPTIVVVLKPDHVRDVDLFVRRYDARAFGPWLFSRDNIPETDLEPIEPGSVLPGGFVAVDDGRGRNETPLWFPEPRVLVFADALIGAEEGLRIWDTPHIGRARTSLRKLLELPFEYVVVSHGEPVHEREAFESALDLPAWSGEAGA